MTNLSAQNLDFIEVQEMTVLAGLLPPDANGKSNLHLFLSIKVNAPDSNEMVEVLYGMSPWEALKLGCGLGTMAVEVVERHGGVTTPTVPTRRESSPYL